jgi:GlcNAc-P-P-Und epimerase
MNILITGGSGFIGTHLVQALIELESIQKIIIWDVRESGIKNDKVVFQKVDLRKEITDSNEWQIDLCIHLAAICKEPGFRWEEYFDVNYIGTKNLVDFLERMHVTKILFTSTMMVFKAGEVLNREDSSQTPDTAYGISKYLAEEYLLNWAKRNAVNKAIILRPGVVFGKGEKGNYTNLHYSLKRNLFVYIGKKSTIKGSIYVKDLVAMIVYLLGMTSRYSVYNAVIPEELSIERICQTIKKVNNWKRFIPIIPLRLALLAAYFFELMDLVGIRNVIHHRRIEKLYYSTNISSQRIMDEGFKFHFSLEDALIDWKKDCYPEDIY